MKLGLWDQFFFPSLYDFAWNFYLGSENPNISQEQYTCAKNTVAGAQAQDTY